ncbi:MAG: thymidylate kinase [Silvibacterium sp.]|nr:thymidylate kinase [Silvibacterium sp.]
MHAKSDIRRPRFLSFSGIDGAGKSSQIHALRTMAAAAGLRVLVVTFWDDVATLTRLRETAGYAIFKGDKGVGSPEAPINRRDKNVRSRIMTAVRLGLYLLDSISLRCVVNRVLRSNADLIIFDRYAYDELANLDLRNAAARAYARMIMRLVPKPDISYLLDADPAQARARKPEYPVEFLHASRASYLHLSRLLGSITVIPALPIEEVECLVLRQASMQLCFENAQDSSSAVAQEKTRVPESSSF